MRSPFLLATCLLAALAAALAAPLAAEAPRTRGEALAYVQQQVREKLKHAGHNDIPPIVLSALGQESVLQLMDQRDDWWTALIPKYGSWLGTGALVGILYYFLLSGPSNTRMAAGAGLATLYVLMSWFEFFGETVKRDDDADLRAFDPIIQRETTHQTERLRQPRPAARTPVDWAGEDLFDRLQNTP